MYEFKYCFLNKVFIDSNDYDNKYYEFVLTDEYNERTSILNLSTKQLLQKHKDKILDNFIKDFQIVEGDILKIDPNVEEVLIEDVNSFELDTLISASPVITNNFYEFLRKGIYQDYLFIPEYILDVDDYYGTGITHFNNIKFSSTTFTVMFMYNYKDETTNRFSVISQEDKDIVFNPFYYAEYDLEDNGIKYTNDTEYGIYVKHMKINGLHCKIYKTRELPILLDRIQISIPVLNRALNSINRYSNIESMYEELIAESVPSSAVLPYAPSSSRVKRRDDLGYKLKAGFDKLTKKDIKDLITIVDRDIIPLVSDFAVLEEELDKNKITKYDPFATCAWVLGVTRLKYKDDEHRGYKLIKIYERHKKYRTFYEIYVHMIRVFLYMRSISLSDKDVTMLYGSDINYSSTAIRGEMYD